MDKRGNENSENRSESSETRKERKEDRIEFLKVANCSTSTNVENLARIPKRKLSVFYRSFDVIAQIADQEEKETLDFRRTSSSPSVRGDKEDVTDLTRTEVILCQTDLCKKGFVDNCRSLIESGKFFGNSIPDHLGKISSSTDNEPPTKAVSLSPTAFKIPEVIEDKIVDNYSTIVDTSIGKHFKLNNNGSNEIDATTDGSVNVHSHPNDSSANMIADTFTGRKIGQTHSKSSTDQTNDRQRGNSQETCQIGSDLVNIKDSEYPRSFVNESNTDRLGKYIPVDAEMSSHEDSSIGSESEDDLIERKVNGIGRTRADFGKFEMAKCKNSILSSQSFLPFATGSPSGRTEIKVVHKLKETDELPEHCTKPEKRQKFFFTGRSLSDGDCERYHRAKHSNCIKGDIDLGKLQHYPAFPSFNDTRLQDIGVSKADDMDSLYRENIPETELERNYIAFSIGLGTDRITLPRRLALSIRQRDQSERNFRNEIQKMEEDIQNLCPLCTDQESVDKVTQVRNRLHMIERSVHGISCTAETLGAVYQEHRISRAILIGDKYLQLLRTRCEDLATEIAEIKQILWKHNIVIEETSTDIDLSKLRYRNGLPGNNRTMVARRRASIATISRPLSSQDMIKETPRCCSQRNSVSGRVTLRRPSLCSDVQSNSSSVVELRDILEHTESRRNSTEENNNLLRIQENNGVDGTNCDIANNTEKTERLITKQNSFLESKVSRTVEKQLKSCIRTAEPLRITKNIEVWRPIFWYMLIFFLGYYARQITSMFDTCDVQP